MICPRCGAPNSPSDKFCAVCSAPLSPQGGLGPQGGQGFAPPQPFPNQPFPPPYNPQGQGMGGPGMPPPPYDPNYGQMGGPGMGGQMGGPGMGGQMGGPGMGGPFDQGFNAPPPPFPPPPGYDQGGYPAPGGSGGFPPPAEPDAFGQTAFAPQPAPGAPPPMGQQAQQPMPPTSAMSGFGGDQRASTGGSKARRALVGFLVSFQDDTLGKFWPLFQGRNLVGRAETGQEVDVAIGHGTTSTNHATIEADQGRMTLSDLGSTNGTFHNEEAIGFQGRRDLRDGDKVRFGGFSVIIISVAARA